MVSPQFGGGWGYLLLLRRKRATIMGGVTPTHNSSTHFDGKHVFLDGHETGSEKASGALVKPK